MKEFDRTNYCGEINNTQLDKNVKVIGWVAKKRNLGSLVFIDLRDRSGILQIVIKTNELNTPEIRNEYILSVEGKISLREIENKDLKTGKFELIANKIEVINTAEQPPIIISDKTDASEDIRLKYRYLDLRRNSMQKHFFTRAKIVKCVHEFLDKNEFIEIETPTLTLSSPEGAKEYLVPSRIHHGSFYALPQSPQLYKQLLMVSGFERYYQIAKCFRDEDLRSDRQPDFTQIDIETSFLNEDQILTLSEELLQYIFKNVINHDIKLPLRRIEYDEAIHKYGSDKPDTRFGMLIEDVKEILNKGEFESYINSDYVCAIKCENIANDLSRKKIDELSLLANKFNLKNYQVYKVLNNEINSSLNKFFNLEILNKLKDKMNAKENDVIFVAHGKKRDVLFGLGALRNDLAKKLNLIKEGTYDLLWVTHFPLFGINDEGNIVAEHHPFTRPCDEDIDKLKTNPEQVYSYAYDIVINGYEAGGGSLRIYNQDLQKTIFEVLNVSEEDIQKKFGWFVEALKYGTPPHGGLAFGLDRLTMILSGTDNIRDVIAFPKNLSAVCPMTNAPREVSEEQLKELGLIIDKENR
ncbi:MAG: aspartate--tRNA ligase [Bacillales bacterium]